MDADGCPTSEELQLLGSSHYGTDTFVRLESHVQSCVACADRLEMLAREGSADTGAGSRKVTEELPQIPGFVILKKLGRGGAGVVYEALQPSIGRKVALKLLTRDDLPQEALQQRWLTEVRALGRIRHPHVVRLLDAGEHERQRYLVLELISGGTLKSRMTSLLPLREAVRLVACIARAADVLHRAGIVHLDIKPSNILLDTSESEDLATVTPLLSDFGISYCSAEVAAGSDRGFWEGPRGTPSYMAPEQVTGNSQSIGRRTDVFALGATLYALLTGRPPFHAATREGTLDQVRACSPIPPRLLVPDLPLDLETICQVCLSRDPARRYPDALQLADDLQRWLDGHVIHARPVSLLERLLRWHRRQPVKSALVLATSAATVVVITSLTWLWRQSEHHRLEAQSAVIRAERGEFLSAEALQQLMVLLQRTVNLTATDLEGHSAEILTTIAKLTRALQQLPEVARAHLTEVLTIEQSLCEHFQRQDADDSLRQLLTEARLLAEHDAERLKRDTSVAEHYGEILFKSADLYRKHGDFELAEQELQRAEAVLLLHAASPAVIPSLLRSFGIRMEIAQRLLEDRPERSARMEQAARNLVRQFALATSDDNNRQLITAFASSSSLNVLTAEQLYQLVQQFPDQTTHVEMLQQMLVTVLAADVCRQASCEIASEKAAERVAAESFQELQRQMHAMDLRPDLQARVIEILAQRAQVLEIEARRSGQFAKARRVVEWMLSLGIRLRDWQAEAASPHYLLSKGFEHKAKLAWTVPDAAAATDALQSALVEATHAVKLNDGSATYQQHLSGIRVKYLTLVSEVDSD
jgi:serine/threonine protein kinase